eukprot:1189072-Prorocentrum_minimum.AAC.3
MVMVPMCSVTNAGHHHNSLHQDKTLLLCWPPQHSPMALNALCSYRGDQTHSPMALNALCSYRGDQ